MLKVSVTKRWNQRIVGHLIPYRNDSESDNPPPEPPPPPPPPPHIAQPSHVNPVQTQSSHANPVPARPSHVSPVPARSSHINPVHTQSSPANPVPARPSHVSPVLANWHSIESATCHTYKTPKLVFNPETEQGFCLNNQLTLTLILHVLSSQTPVIRLEPHPSYMKPKCFID